VNVVTINLNYVIYRPIVRLNFVGRGKCNDNELVAVYMRASCVEPLNYSAVSC